MAYTTLHIFIIHLWRGIDNTLRNVYTKCMKQIVIEINLNDEDGMFWWDGNLIIEDSSVLHCTGPNLYIITDMVAGAIVSKIDKYPWITKDSNE